MSRRTVDETVPSCQQIFRPWNTRRVVSPLQSRAIDHFYARSGGILRKVDVFRLFIDVSEKKTFGLVDFCNPVTK